MWIAIIISSVVLFLLTLFLIVLYGLYRYSFYSPKKGQLDDFNLSAPLYRGVEKEVTELIKGIRSYPYEDIYISSFDKLKLHARLFENKENNKIAILCHGYRGTACRDFSGGAQEIIALGYNVVLIDERAHGQSQGHSITMGVREVNDLLSWIDYAYQRFGKNIELVLVGISMGGATVLMAADKVENAKIIADCPFSSPKIMLKETISQLNLSPKAFYPILNLSAILFAHTNMNKRSAYDSIKNTNNKILIIHGDSDKVVPHRISYDLYQTYPDKIQYELFEGANHGLSYLVDTKRYREIIHNFLK